MNASRSADLRTTAPDGVQAAAHGPLLTSLGARYSMNAADPMAGRAIRPSRYLSTSPSIIRRAVVSKEAHLAT